MTHHIPANESTQMYLPLIKPILLIAARIASIIVYAITILAAYGGRFDTDFFTIPAVLTLALPYFAIASLLITIAWFVCGKIFTGAVGVLAIIAVWGPVSTACPLKGSKKPTPGAQTFTVMTYNILHGWDLENKSPDGNRTIEYIINSGVDIVCVQELIKLSDEEVPNLTPELEARLRKAYPFIVGSPSLDMKVLSKYPVVYEKAGEYIDGEFDPRRFTFYKVNINGHELKLIDVHLMSFALTSSDRKIITGMGSVSGVKRSINIFRGDVRHKLSRGFKKRKKDARILRNTIDRMDGPMIICGDFNDVPESYAYRLLKGDDLRDAYAETGFGPLITYNKHAFWFHLDQILYGGGLKALSVKKGTLKSSDHYPLIAEFEFTGE